jgi:hypothetical protein
LPEHDIATSKAPAATQAAPPSPEPSVTAKPKASSARHPAAHVPSKPAAGKPVTATGSTSQTGASSGKPSKVGRDVGY